MKVFDYMKWAQTGDIVLMSGSSGFSKLIKELTGCKYSHVAIVVRGEDVGLGNNLYVWESTGRGVGEVDFLQACRVPDTSFLSRMANYGAGDIGVRPVSGERTPLMLDNLKRHMEQYRGSSYEDDKLEMLKSVGWVKACGLCNHEQALSSQFCWEAAAAALQALGVFPSERPANSYSNTDFAGNSLICTAETGATVQPLVLLEF